ncbi:hypothetical protein L6Q21_09530 [Sandaracinobacter sp. RS1-74]|uniref:hypothetical protein n=1 Tax=Sandaracinobacteroides sayramensis TaxID=2913411 RepID=UPI001EDC4BB3|nr:hypothetical protein [Sandaracinobacteroides sayramensis]MCG2841219.1 hypothetical protein [Sandaracinobacteroides sayramensis]
MMDHKSFTQRRSARRGRAARWLGALFGVGVAAMAPASAQSVAPSAAPSEWVAYAEGATAAITAWLQAEDEPARRLRAYLDGTRKSPGERTAPLVLKLWIDRDGTVSRIEFTPFAHAEANADLRSLIVGRKLDGKPPRDMLLPMLIAVQLDAAPAPQGGAPGAGRTI